MTFERLWPLLFLAAVPIIVILYLLKPRGRDRKVSSNLLWRRLLKNEQAKTFFEKFVHNILMYLQILAVLCLVAAFMAPYIMRQEDAGGRRILLFDISGSMQHTDSAGKSRLEDAVERACVYVKSLENTSFSLMTVDASGAELLAVDISDTDSLIKLMRGLQCSDGGGSLTAAQGILDTLAGSGVSEGEFPGLVVYTDGEGAGDFDLLRCEGGRELVAVGEASSNVAGEYTVCAQTDDGLWDVMTGTVNYSGETAVFDVSLYDEDDRLLGVKQMRLGSGESRVCLFQGIDWTGDVLTSRISGISFSQGAKDSLKADNVSYAVKEKEGLISGLLLGRGNIYIEKAYSAVTGESLARSDTDSLAAGGAYNVLIYDAGQVPGETAFNMLRFGDAFGEAEEILKNVVLTVKECGLTKGLQEFDIGVNTAYCFALPEGAESFLEYQGKCVGYYRNYEGGREVVIGFDIRESEFPLMAEFPVFLANAMTYLSDTSWLALHVGYAGQEIALQPWAEVDRAQYESRPEKAGVYGIGNEEHRERYVARFQTATESDGRKTAVSSGGVDGTEAGRVQVKQTLKNLFLVLALLLLAVEWAVYARQYRYRGWFYAVVRGAVVLCVLLALFGVRVRLGGARTATVFVVDLSDSNEEKLKEMSDYLGRTVNGMPDGDSYGIVTFGREALVEQFLTSEKRFGGLMTVPKGTATNFEQAVSTALTMIPGDCGGRILLLTDGRQTGGDIQNMARVLAAGKTEFLTLLYESEEVRDAYIENVEIPSYLHPGDEYAVTVLVESNYETDAELGIYSGSSRAMSGRVHLNAGSNRFVFRQQAGDGTGTENLRVRIQAPGDACGENDFYSAYAALEAQPKTLVISGMGVDAFPFLSLLDAAGCDVDAVSALNAPADINAMLEYRCIILANVYIDDLPQSFLDNLETYVKDYGCGFVCCGGEDSFALGGYRDTVLETVLPVDMELRGVDELPSMAMVMVIDHSGSMSEEADGAGMSNLDIAVRAATVAVDNLRDSDYVGVLTFDDSFNWQVEIQKAADRNAIRDSIRTIREGGGTTIKPALREACRAVADCRASVRHVILLTDGMGETADYKDVIQFCADRGITLSTVAVGENSDTRLLKQLAEDCGGRYYYSDLSSDIPRIFAREVFLGGDSYIQNGNFALTVNSGHELTEELFGEGWPAVYGYVSATPKSTSRMLIASAEKNNPILTVWQYGLGRTAAWNSDVTGEWTGAFQGREDYVRLWKRIVDYAAGSAGLSGDSADVSVEAGIMRLSYRTSDYDGGTEVYATVIDPEGEAAEVKLYPTAPGRYEADVAAEEAGLYHFNIRRADAGEIRGYMTTAAAVQFSDEYKFDVGTDELMKFTEQNGRLITPEENIWKPVADSGESRSLANFFMGLAIALFLADVAVRRFQYEPVWARRGIEKSGSAGKGRDTGEGKPAGEGKAGTRQSVKHKQDGAEQTLDTSRLLKKKGDRNI